MAKRGLLANIFHRSDPNDRDQLKIQEEKMKDKVLHARKLISRKKWAVWYGLKHMVHMLLTILYEP